MCCVTLDIVRHHTCHLEWSTVFNSCYRTEWALNLGPAEVRSGFVMYHYNQYSLQLECKEIGAALTYLPSVSVEMWCVDTEIDTGYSIWSPVNQPWCVHLDTVHWKASKPGLSSDIARTQCTTCCVSALTHSCYKTYLWAAKMRDVGTRPAVCVCLGVCMCLCMCVHHQVSGWGKQK